MRRAGPRADVQRRLARVASGLLLGVLAGPAAGEVAPARVVVAVLPFEVHSERPLGYLEGSLADLLSTRLEASGRVSVVQSVTVRETLIAWPGEKTEDTLRRLARELKADWVVIGSLTELAGRYSLDVRVTPAMTPVATSTMVLSAASANKRLDRVNGLAGKVLQIVGGESAATRVARIDVVGAPDEAAVRAALRTRAGEPYEGAQTREDVAAIEKLPGIATADVSAEHGAEGVVVTYRVVPRARLLPGASGENGSQRLAEVQVRGNQRIESAAILARVTEKPGDPVNAAHTAGGLRAVCALGFFRDVQVYEEQGSEGVLLVFQVQENPVIRQVTISGNEHIDSEKIKDNLTLTTGATLDYPLLFENRQRIEGLFRAEGYYLAKVRSEVDPLPGDAVAVHFEVDEGKKLKLRRIEFVGNERKTDAELSEGLKTQTWHWYSWATSWLDKSGTYSEPVFMQDLDTVNKKYLDDGYVRVDVGAPEVKPEADGLVVQVPVREGDQYHLGTAQLTGDDTVDFAKLHEQLKLADGAVFSRAKLNADLETIQSHYTDRGFFMAQVQPRTQVDEAQKQVDVDYDVKKGSLYFLREIEVSGNHTTVDPVIRREVKLVEGQLYSAHALDVSKQRIQGLGYFEEVNFEPRQTDFENQLDMNVKVVEKPTGSLSFGAGVSSADGFVVSGAVSDTNLFGRGYAASLGADVGGVNEHYFLNFAWPYFMDTNWGLSTQISRMNLKYDNNKYEYQTSGAEVAFSHPLDDAGQTRGFVRYGFTEQNLLQSLQISGEVPVPPPGSPGIIDSTDQGANTTAASLIFRDIYQGDEITSLIGLGFRQDTRNDKVAATQGHVIESSVDFAGVGGFSNFARWEGRAGFFFKYPEWFPDWIPFKEKSAWLLGGRMGYTMPLNTIGDWNIPGYDGDLAAVNLSGKKEMLPLTMIDKNLELPLAERYFLGGIGAFQLRGFQARSVGPRRSVLQAPIVVPPSGTSKGGTLFTPVGRQWFTGECLDTKEFKGFEGNGNGKCNSINDREINQFADLDETNVIGGNKFISLTAEYRFPIAESFGLMGIVFLDTGNAFAEDQSIFDFSAWRQGTGVGVLWFSPFGPLQAFIGFPINKLSVEDSMAFEFSVGGQGF